MSSNTEPQFSKIVLDANIGHTNAISGDDMHELISSTLAIMLNTLTDHCGPNGKFAILHDNREIDSGPAFTKDGIDIIRSLEFMNPSQDFIKKVIAYVGSKVETTVGDGTTSGMILMISALKHLNDNLPETYNYRQMFDSYSQFLLKFNELLTKEAYTVDKLIDTVQKMSNMTKAQAKKKVIEFICFNQTYTSSHGDTDLAHAVATVFANTPESAWDNIVFRRENRETDERYRVEIDDSQFSMECKEFMPHMLNTDMGTAYEGTADILVIPTPLLDGDHVSMSLMSLIDKYAEVGDSLIIVTAAGIDHNLRKSLTHKFNKDASYANISMFTAHVPNPHLSDMVILSLVAGVDPSVYNRQPLHIPKVHAKFRDNRLTLSGLYEADSSSTIHPYFNDPAKGFIKDTLGYITNLIEQTKKSRKTPMQINNELIKYYEFYNRVFLSQRTVVYIGGSSYDNTAALPVVLDAIKAVKSSLRGGFVAGQHRTLLKIIYDELDNDPMPTGIMQNIFNALFGGGEMPFSRKYVEAFEYAIETLHDAIYKYATGDAAPIDAESPMTFKDLTTNRTIEFTMYNIANDIVFGYNNPYIMQPAAVDKTILDRFGEVALRIINTQRIHTADGVCTTKPTSVK